MAANSKIFTLEARLRQSEPLLQYTKELQAQVKSSSLYFVWALLYSVWHLMLDIATML